MRRALLALAACVAVGAGLAARGTRSSADGRELLGTIGPGLTIHLSDADGQPVTSLRPGNYWLTVNDPSTFHNYHVFGPGLDNVVTDVPFVGTVTVKIHLSHGQYTYQCDPHAAMGMRGSFDVSGEGQGS
jgi:hypothetical protein